MGLNVGCLRHHAGQRRQPLHLRAAGRDLGLMELGSATSARLSNDQARRHHHRRGGECAACDELEQGLDSPIAEGKGGMTDCCQRRGPGPGVEDVIEADCRDVIGDSQAGLAQRVDCTQA